MLKKVQFSTVLSALTVLSLGIMATVAVAEPVQDSVSQKIEKPVKKKVAAKKIKKGARALGRFKAMDQNNNGAISNKEFVAYHKAQFQKKDKNKDGKLSKAELSPTLAKLKK